MKFSFIRFVAFSTFLFGPVENVFIFGLAETEILFSSLKWNIYTQNSQSCTLVERLWHDILPNRIMIGLIFNTVNVEEKVQSMSSMILTSDKVRQGYSRTNFVWPRQQCVSHVASPGGKKIAQPALEYGYQRCSIPFFLPDTNSNSQTCALAATED